MLAAAFGCPAPHHGVPAHSVRSGAPMAALLTKLVLHLPCAGAREVRREIYVSFEMETDLSESN